MLGSASRPQSSRNAVQPTVSEFGSFTAAALAIPIGPPEALAGEALRAAPAAHSKHQVHQSQAQALPTSRFPVCFCSVHREDTSLKSTRRCPAAHRLRSSRSGATTRVRMRCLIWTTSPPATGPTRASRRAPASRSPPKSLRLSRTRALHSVRSLLIHCTVYYCQL